MRVYTIIITSFILLFYTSCAPTVLLTTDIIQQERIQENTTYRIVKEVDLQGRTITLPQNCTLCFSKNGSLKNGTIIGQNTRIRYSKPFIGDSLTITGCTIIRKKLIRDTDVFLSVNHTQNEIQSLFNLSGGIKLKFSRGTYDNVEKIEINNSIEADFSSSLIRLAFDKHHVGECFYMEPWVDKHIDYVRIKNLKIEGERNGIKSQESRRCIQLFYVSEVELDNIIINKFYGGLYEYKEDASDLLNKTRIGSSSIAIVKYDKCRIKNCCTYDVSKEIFWCVPNNNPRNITYFENNKSYFSAEAGSASFFTLLDGRCIVKNNEVHNYNGSAFNVFCYDSEISNNSFYDGKRSVAIDLSEGLMYRAYNVSIHHNSCINTKGFLVAYGENIYFSNNNWTNTIPQTGKRFALININTRGERSVDGKYIGSDNNPNQDTGSTHIFVSNNIFNNDCSENELDIRCACMFGDRISYTNNTMRGFNMPVVQLVDGDLFNYSCNNIRHSIKGRYAELLINRGNGIFIKDNVFFQNHKKNNKVYTVQILSAEGELRYERNEFDNIDFLDNDIYVPCFVEDQTLLNNATIYVREEGLKTETGLDFEKVSIKTNIRHR